jgi:hypothetical protein
MTLSSTSGLSEAEQVRAFERYQILRPFLEEGVPAWEAPDRCYSTRASYHAVAFSRWEQTEDAPGPVEATGGWAGAIVIIRAGQTTLVDYEHGP